MENSDFVKLVFKKQSLEGKNTKEIAEDVGVSEYKVKKALKSIDSFLTEYDKEKIREYALDSIDVIKDKFETLIDKAEGILERAEESGKDMTALSAIKQIESLLTTAMKRLGELKSGFTSIKTDTINIENLTMVAKQIQERFFEENRAELEEDVLIFKKPKAETIDNYSKWKKKKVGVKQDE